MDVVLKVWSLNQLQRHHLGTCYKSKLSDSNNNKIRNLNSPIYPVEQGFKVIVMKNKV